MNLEKEDEDRLLVFEMIWLRKILCVSRVDKFFNTTIRKSLGLKENVIERISQKRLRYYDQTHHKDEHPENT